VTITPDERGAELRELFFETSQELLQALNEETLKLEKNPGDEEIVRAIRRTVHTLKGDSAACGLRELSELAHQFEDALSLETPPPTRALAEIALPRRTFSRRCLPPTTVAARCRHRRSAEKNSGADRRSRGQEIAAQKKSAAPSLEPASTGPTREARHGSGARPGLALYESS
jgi:chemotaxis protein histidine kinase CheA